MTVLPNREIRLKFAFQGSFSGIKSAVQRYISDHPDEYPKQVPDIAAGFQEAVLEVLTYKVMRAAVEKGCDRIVLVGGVAANSRLREKLRNDAGEKKIEVYIPSLIAAAGYHYLKAGLVADLQDDVFSK